MEFTTVERFLEFDCEELSNNSKKSYKSDIMLFLNSLCEKKILSSESELLQSIVNDDVEDWTITQRGGSFSTINRRITALRKYFKYIYEAKKIITSNPFDGIKLKKPPKRIEKDATLNYKLKQGKNIISKEEVEKLIKATYDKIDDERNFSFVSARDRFLLSLLFTTGLRIEEALGINICQLTEKNDVIIVQDIDSKTGMIKRVPIANVCLRYYKEYLLARNLFSNGKKTDCLLINERGTRWNKDGVNDRIGVLLSKANIGKHITCHCFRYGFKTYSTALGNINADIIAMIGGWKGELSSQSDVYLSNIGQHDKAMIEACNIL